MSLPTDGLQVETSETKPKPDDYVIVGGNRLVKPYHFDFVCNVRQRWCGQSVIDIFSREFPARSRDYYRRALADGRLRVEGQNISEDTPVTDGMRMRHFIHRHEPPVPAGPVKVISKTPDIVAVCKPAGMPVHVSGQYRKNTVHGILMAERPDLGDLLPVHRLDKPVSGLLLFARSSAAANALRQKIEDRTVDKVYVARVMGVFPASETPIVVDVPLSWDPTTNHACAEPLYKPAGAPAAAVGTQGDEAQPPCGDEPGDCCSAPGTTSAAALDATAGGISAQVGERSGMNGIASGTQGGGGAGKAGLPSEVGTRAERAMQREPPGQQDFGGAAPNGCALEARGMQPLAPVQQGQQERLLSSACMEQSDSRACGEVQVGQGAHAGQATKTEAQHAGRGRRTGKERRAAKRAKLAAATAAGEQRGQGRAKAGRGEARPAMTEYRLLWAAPDGTTSLVECRPRTGRTHQIRVHLQWLGHPIANDAQYGGTYGGPLPSRHMAQQLGVAWGSRREESGGAPAAGPAPAAPGAATAGTATPAAPSAAALDAPSGGSQPDAALLPHAALEKAQRQQAGQEGGVPQTCAWEAGGEGQDFLKLDASNAVPQDMASQDAFAQSLAFRSSYQYQAPPSLRDPLCIHCPYYAPKDYPLDLRPLWLHARTYSCQGGEWSFSADPPDWAQPDYQAY